MSEMTSSRPYLLRALYEWITDNGLTPHVLVDAHGEGVTVPVQHIEDGKIVLNIGPAAIQHFRITNQWVVFEARFSGKATEVSFPTDSVLAIYSRENGQGMMLPVTGRAVDRECSKERPNNNKQTTNQRGNIINPSQRHLKVLK